MAQEASLTFNKLEVSDKGKDFRKATRLAVEKLPTTVDADAIIVRNIYAGVNAADINAVSKRSNLKAELPHAVGLEALGQVVQVGSSVDQVAVDDYVVVFWLGGYSEYQTVPSSACIKVAEPDPRYLALNVSGLAAAISLGELSQPKEDDVALVTAAAGATGSIAVQVLKRKYKCRVVGTCSTEKKAEYLHSIGCDVVINYTAPKDEVVRQMIAAAPNGFNVIFESIGGSLREMAMRNLAYHGRIILIGSLSGYKDGSVWLWRRNSLDPIDKVTKNGDLLQRSAMICGFFLPDYRDCIPAYYAELVEMMEAKTITVRCDTSNSFVGLGKVADAVEFLHSGKNCGKVFVKVSRASEAAQKHD